MEFFKRQTHINFMRTRKIALTMSIVVFVAAVISLVFGRGLNLGIDFTGGVVVQVTYPQAVQTQTVRQTLQKAGFKSFVVQHFGSPQDIMIRLQPRKDQVAKTVGGQVVSALQAQNSKVVEKQVNVVGPQVGNELRTKGYLALIVTLIMIFIYLLVRFEWRLALGAVAATLHDLVFVVGIFSFAHLDFNLDVLAAVLAVLGYSVNDTVVVFDRIRENFKRMRRGDSIEIINAAINQTLSRTIMTSGMTLLVVIALLVVGGPSLRGFSLALLIGIGVGTYSSIYIASATAYMLGVSRQNFATKKRNTADDMP
ncbi:MAG TPA: protein translocase subunit SecF [Gammaproteobacteria bacterium]|nr:protein translocase subunit SecF [Gammaproteobacteria bacterium]